MTTSPFERDSRRFSAISSSALSSSGNWSIGEADENGSELEVDLYDLTYHGSVNIDRRYVPSVFQWLAKKILRLKKTNENVTAHIHKTVLQITERFDHKVVTQEHSFDSIYRLSRLRHCGLDNYFAYIIHENPESPVSSFHVFECDNTDTKAEFLRSLKTRVLEFQKAPWQDPGVTQESATPFNITPPMPTHRRGGSAGPILVSHLPEATFRDSVYYIGKVTISQPQAPPKFIDDVLVQLNKMHSARQSRANSISALPGETNHALNCSKKMHSFDFGMMAESRNVDEQPDPIDKEVIVRQRSISMLHDSKKDFEQTLKKCREKINPSEEASKDNHHPSDEDHAIKDDVHSRLVTLQVSKMFLMLFSVGSKTLLLEKKINNISFCTKGDFKSDHFGFICREGGSHVCYIFQGESEQKVEAIMRAMKQAFNEALDASAHLTLCESCPLQIFHRLCIKLESMPTIAERYNLIQEYSECLTEYEQLHISEQVNEKSPLDDMERIEININVLREVFDGKQMNHKHSHRVPANIMHDPCTPRERTRSSTIFEKAKKSLTSSFASLMQPKVNGSRETSPRCSSENLTKLNKPRTRSFDSSDNFPPLLNRSNSHSDGTSETSSERKRSRNSSVSDVESHVPEVVVEQNEDTFDEEAKMFSPSEKGLPLHQRKGSWRQAIYNSVVSDSRKGSVVSNVPNEEHEPDEKDSLDPGQRARARWKQAINNQILLIRMDRENKKLAANIRGTQERREKMSYTDFGTVSAESIALWDDLLTHNDSEKLDNHILFDAVRNGVPKARRGDIWQLLIKQFVIRSPETSTQTDWRNHSLQSLLKEDTNHQHAILIDLGRTFPTYEYFVTRLGPGQLGLFNVLKAYSLLDKEVGYCQGLSFVAGLLLMHMSEEEAFKSFCHIMFDLKIRRQYKPDMGAVQQQLYQLSRLLHDYHPKLTQHLNFHDVTPTLYAAPWFLTLFASQYPIGFVSRVMDLLLLQGLEVIFKVALVLVGNHAEQILKCDCFEAIVEYMKTTIPEKVVNDTDDICTRVLEMDIKQQLNLYEVEYQLLNEMVDMRNNRERMEKQEREQKELETKVKTLEADLAKANETIASLKLLEPQLAKAYQTIASLTCELVETKRQKERDLLNSSCDRDVLTLRLDRLKTGSQAEEKDILNNNYSDKSSNFLSSPDSSSSLNCDLSTPNDSPRCNGDSTAKCLDCKETDYLETPIRKGQAIKDAV